MSKAERDLLKIEQKIKRAARRLKYRKLRGEGK
jgi:hypothetical protein